MLAVTRSFSCPDTISPSSKPVSGSKIPRSPICPAVPVYVTTVEPGVDAFVPATGIVAWRVVSTYVFDVTVVSAKTELIAIIDAIAPMNNVCFIIFLLFFLFACRHPGVRVPQKKTKFFVGGLGRDPFLFVLVLYTYIMALKVPLF